MSSAANFIFVKMGDHSAVIEHSDGHLTVVSKKYDYALVIPFRDKVTIFNEKITITADCVPVKIPPSSDTVQQVEVEDVIPMSVRVSGIVTPQDDCTFVDLYKEYGNQATLEKKVGEKVCKYMWGITSAPMKLGGGGPNVMFGDEYFNFRFETATMLLHMDKVQGEYGQ